MERCSLLLLYCGSLFLSRGFAQSPNVVNLTMRIQNSVQYRDDLGDPVRVGTQPGVIPWRATANFYPLVGIADIAEINGKPARGMIVLRGLGLSVTRNAQPGQATADSPGRVAVYDAHIDILDDQGRPVGSIAVNGIGGGPQAPGLPAGFGTLPVTGGSGAYLGAKGQMAATGAFRLASMAEDPSNRQINGGTSSMWVIQLIPLLRPEIVTMSGMPAIFHDDFAPVTAARPGRAGELLIANVTGLGAVRGQPTLGDLFPTNPIVEVASPVEVKVNGREAEVVNKSGWPGTSDRYRVDFRIPEGIAPGMAAVQLTAAWIPGQAVDIPVR